MEQKYYMLVYGLKMTKRLRRIVAKDALSYINTISSVTSQPYRKQKQKRANVRATSQQNENAREVESAAIS